MVIPNKYMQSDFMYMPQFSSPRVKQEVVSSVYTIKFDSDITTPDSYDAEIAVLEQATPNDVVIAHINTCGGLSCAMTMIVDAIDNCVAPVIGKITGNAYSAGSFIAMHCDDLEVVTGGDMMIHTSQTGYADNASELKVYSDHSYKVSEALNKETYKGFLSDAEIQQVNEGKNLWFSDVEIRERWDRRKAYLLETKEPITEEEMNMYLPMVVQQFFEQATALGLPPEELYEIVGSCLNSAEEITDDVKDVDNPVFEDYKKTVTVYVTEEIQLHITEDGSVVECVDETELTQFSSISKFVSFLLECNDAEYVCDILKALKIKFVWNTGLTKLAEKVEIALNELLDNIK